MEPLPRILQRFPKLEQAGEVFGVEEYVEPGALQAFVEV